MQIFQSPLLSLLLGFFLAILIGYLAYRAGALSSSGAWAAALTGGLIFGLGGLAWAALLLTFFISSSALSRAFSRRKQTLSEKFAKGNRRDAGQVLANGGLGAALALASAWLPDGVYSSGGVWLWVAFAGAMAAVNADTWATELGVLSRSAPRRITTWEEAERGSSGAVSLTGYLAALGGAALVAGVAAAFSPALPALRLVVSVVAGALAGSSADSLLGATLQAIYFCPSCHKETERYPLHLCGTQTVWLRGWRWLNNDLVNFACSLVGSIVAFLLYLIW